MANLALVVIVVVGVGATLCSAKCGQLYESKVSEADKSIILDTHNYVRSLISQGKVPGQPQGRNLNTLKWDDRLAKEAQKVANTCEFKHIEMHDGRFAVGQNLARTSSSRHVKGSDWKRIILSWFNEHKDFHYPNISNGVTGHYTQVVWADTSLIGCGYTEYRKNLWYEKLYVCNYGPAGNYVGQAPYKI